MATIDRLRSEGKNARSQQARGYKSRVAFISLRGIRVHCHGTDRLRSIYIIRGSNPPCRKLAYISCSASTHVHTDTGAYADGGTHVHTATGAHADGRTYYHTATGAHADGRTYYHTATGAHADGRTYAHTANGAHADGRTYAHSHTGAYADGRTYAHSHTRANACGYSRHVTCRSVCASLRFSAIR